MRKAVAIVGILIATSAGAADSPSVAKARKAVEEAVKASLNDPDSVKFDSMTLYRQEDGSVVGCGQLRAKNAYGGYVRNNYVVTGKGSMPVYIGTTPLEVFKNDCRGEVVK